MSAQAAVVRPRPRVLLVVLAGLNAPIKLDRIFWIFTQFGVVERMCTFSRSNQNQVLVQFEDPDVALAAMDFLNGRDVEFRAPDVRRWVPGHRARGCCTFRMIRAAKTSAIEFDEPDDSHADYARVNRLIRQCMTDRSAGVEDWDSMWRTICRGACVEDMCDFVWREWVRSQGFVHPRTDDLERGEFPVPDRLRLRVSEGGVGHCIVVDGLPLMPADGGRGAGPVCFTAHMTWCLLGVTGGLVAVKHLYHQSESVLAQYEDAAAADRAAAFFNGWQLFDKVMAVCAAEATNAQNWRDAGGELQPFMCTVLDEGVVAPAAPRQSAWAGVRVAAHPTALVMVSSEDVAERLLRPLFVQQLPPRIAPYTFESDRGVAVLQFMSTDCAAEAVARMNTRLVEGVHLRMHFAEAADCAAEAVARMNTRLVEGVHLRMHFAEAAAPERAGQGGCVCVCGCGCRSTPCSECTEWPRVP